MKVEGVDGKMHSITKSFYESKKSAAYQRGARGASAIWQYKFEEEAYNKGEEDSRRSLENK